MLIKNKTVEALHKKLFSTIKDQKIKCHIENIQKWFEFAFTAHDWQFRGSWEPYIIHPLEVAIILTWYWADEDSIIASLLHDCVEDCDVTSLDIKKNFWAEIALIVDWLTKVDEVISDNFNSFSFDWKVKSKEIETIRKILEKSKNDIRIILIKMADRLHNIRTLSWMKKEKSRIKKAKETMNIFIKIADKLWLTKIKNEFFDICYLELHPEKHFQIKEFINENKEKKNIILKEILDKLKKNDSKKIIKDIFIYEKNTSSLSKILANKWELILNDNLVLDLIIENKNDFNLISQLIKSSFSIKFNDIKKEESYETSSNNPYYQIYSLDIIDKNWSIIQFRIMTKEMMKTNMEWVLFLLFQKKIKPKLYLFNDFEEINKITKWKSWDFYNAVKSDLLESKITIHNNWECTEVLKNSTTLDVIFYIFWKKALNTKKIFINKEEVFFDTIIKQNDFIEVEFLNKENAQFEWFYFVNKFKSRILLQEFLKLKDIKNKVELWRIKLQEEFDFYWKWIVDNVLNSNFENLKNCFWINKTDDLFTLIYEWRIQVYDVFQQCFPDNKPWFFSTIFKKIDSFLRDRFLLKSWKWHFWIKIRWILDKKAEVLDSLSKNSNIFSINIDSINIKTDNVNNIFNIVVNWNWKNKKVLHNFFIKMLNQEWTIDVLPILSKKNQFLAYFWLFISVFMAWMLPILLFFIEHNWWISIYLKNILIYLSILPVLISNYILSSFIKNYFSQLRNTKLINFLYLFLNLIVFIIFIYTTANYNEIYFSIPVIISIFLIISMLSLIKLLTKKTYTNTNLIQFSQEEWIKKRKQKIIWYIIRFFAVIVWWIQPLFIKYTPANEVDPLLRIFFTWVWWIIPPLLAFIFIYFFIDKTIKKVKLSYNKLFFIIVFWYISFTYLLSLGLMYTTSTNVILINNFAPVLSIILAVLLWRSEIPYLKDKKHVLMIFWIFIIWSIWSSLLFYNDIRHWTQENLFWDFMWILLMIADVILVVALIRYAKSFKWNENSILNININLAIIIASIPLIIWKFDIFKNLYFGQVWFAIWAWVISWIWQFLNLEAFKRIDWFLAFLMFNISILITFIWEVYVLEKTSVSMIIVASWVLIMWSSISAEIINTKCEKRDLAK